MPDKEDGSLLAEAGRTVTGPRQEDYGDPLDNFSVIATMWSSLLGTTITPHQVGLCMVLVKVARQRNGYHHDSNVDLAGYAVCNERVHDRQQQVWSTVTDNNEVKI